MLFGLINLVLLICSPDGTAKLKFLKIYGLAIPSTFLMAILVIFAIKLSGIYPSVQIKTVFFAILISVLAIILANAMVIIGNYMIEFMLNFHERNGTVLKNRPQVSFVIRNRQSIQYVLKAFFFLATLWGLYGLWFGKR